MAVASIEQEVYFTCTVCGEEKPESEYFVYYNKYRKRSYRRSECKLCHGIYTRTRSVRSKIRGRLKVAFADAPYRALIKILKNDPDLINLIVSRHPLEYKRYLRESYMEIFEEQKKKGISYGKGRTKYLDLEAIWEDVRQEFFRNRLKGRAKRTELGEFLPHQ